MVFHSTRQRKKVMSMYNQSNSNMSWSDSLRSNVEINGRVEGERTEENLTRHIYGLCNKRTDFKLQNEFFTKFYLKAFPEKLKEYKKTGWFDNAYCEEWIDRFIGGTPTIHMDNKRLKAYFEVAKEWNGLKKDDVI